MPKIGEEEEKAAVECIRSRNLASYEYITKFQEDFKSYIGVNYALAVSSGTAALHLALVALGIKEGDEVIVPSFTFVAAVNVIKYVNATPVFVDIKKGDFCLDEDQLERYITPKTKAIIAVHMFGNPCNMNKIMEIAKRHNIYVVEDCAESMGSEYYGKKPGSFGDISCFSFYTNKYITTGEGGMCVTNNPNFANIIDSLRAQGKKEGKVERDRIGKPHFYHDYLGYNYRMTDLQAAVGIAQLKKIDKFVFDKRKIIDIYNRLLRNLNVETPLEGYGIKNNFWMYAVLFKDKETRDKVVSNFKLSNIPYREMFFPCHRMPMYNSDKHLPVTEDVFNRGLILPDSQEMNEEEITSVVEKIKEVL